MLQAANIDLFNPLVPEAHNSRWQNLLFPLQASKRQFKGIWRNFIFCIFGTNGVIAIGAGVECPRWAHIIKTQLPLYRPKNEWKAVLLIHYQYLAAIVGLKTFGRQCF